MCPKNTYTLRISNRGTGVQYTKSVERTIAGVTHLVPITWTMNLPACLRSKGPCMITVLHASMESENNLLYGALGLDSNIPQQGADTEQGVSSGAVHRLASFTPGMATAGSHVAYQLTPHTFRCLSLPERLEFTRVSIDTADDTAWPDDAPKPDANYDAADDAVPYYCEAIMTIEFDSY